MDTELLYVTNKLLNINFGTMPHNNDRHTGVVNTGN